MKIAFVFDDSLDKSDGIQQYIFSLAHYYISQGHQVHYLVGETTRRDLANVHSLSRNIKVQFNGNRLSIPLGGSMKRIRKLLKTEKFDVLHVQVPYHPLLAGKIIKAADADTVVIGTFHVAPYSKLVVLATRLLGIWSRPTLRRFNKIVSVSSAAADLARRTFKMDTEVIPNVFDYQRFHTAKPLTQYDDQVKTIVFLGRLVPRKGCLILLQAIVRLQAKNVSHNVRVIICGAGPLEARLKSFVAKHHLRGVVTFVGRISEDDKPCYLASADIAVFPSSAGESFGIVLIEAMASGRAAVLGGDNPGYRSVLGARPRQLFDPQNIEDLARRLKDLLDNEPARQAAASWGKTESKRYDVRTVGADLLQLYETVAHDSRNTS